jgi:uncharacterized protein (TIGR02996 family)
MSNQAPDWLMFRGRLRMMLSTPLESLLHARTVRPDFYLHGPDNHRGYVAQWEIRDDGLLFLTRLMTQPDGCVPDPSLSVLFPDSVGPIEAKWVSQNLRVPNTEQRRYEPIGYSSPFARESFLSVSDGRLVMIEDLDTRAERVIETELTPHLEKLFGAQEGAFLRAIRAEPDDAAPRLIFADWLDEHGDPRGKLLRRMDRLRRLSHGAARRERAMIMQSPADWLWLRIVGFDSASDVRT